MFVRIVLTFLRQPTPSPDIFRNSTTKIDLKFVGYVILIKIIKNYVKMLFKML